MHIRSRNHNQKKRRTELFGFTTASWCLPGPDLVSGTSAGLGQLSVVGPACQDTSQPSPLGANLSLCRPPACQRHLDTPWRKPCGFLRASPVGSALPASFAAFPLPPHSSFWTGNTLPRQSPSLSLPWESGEDKPPLSCKHMGTGEGAPPTHPKCILAEHHQAQYTGDKHKPRSGARAWVGSRRASTQPLEPSSKQEEPCQSSSALLPPPKTPAPGFEPWRSVPAALQGLSRRGEAPRSPTALACLPLLPASSSPDS